MLNELIGNIPRELLRQFPFLFRESNFCLTLLTMGPEWGTIS